MNDLYAKDESCMDFSNEEIDEYLIRPLMKDPKIVIKVISKAMENNDEMIGLLNMQIAGIRKNPLTRESETIIKSLTNSIEELSTKNDEIVCVFFDGDMGCFSISFYKHRTSIFVSDQSPEAKEQLPDLVDFLSNMNFMESSVDTIEAHLSTKRNWTFNEEFMFIDDQSKENTTSSDTYENVVYEGTLRDKTHKEMLELFREFVVLLIGAKEIIVEKIFVSQEGWQYPKYKYVVRITNDSGTKKEVRMENVLFLINV